MKLAGGGTGAECLQRRALPMKYVRNQFGARALRRACVALRRAPRLIGSKAPCLERQPCAPQLEALARWVAPPASARPSIRSPSRQLHRVLGRLQVQLT